MIPAALGIAVAGVIFKFTDPLLHKVVTCAVVMALVGKVAVEQLAVGVAVKLIYPTNPLLAMGAWVQLVAA